MSDTLTTFHISGMHCQSCALNITRRLKKTPGVLQADVNYGNEQATVTYASGFNPKSLSPVIAKLGYQLHWDSTEAVVEQERTQELKRLKVEVSVSCLLAAVILSSMLPWIPALLQNPWLLGILATPIQFYLGRRFYQGAWSALRNASVTMDTLIVLGTSTAYIYSVFALIFGSYLRSVGIPNHTYFEASSAIITFVLLGKYWEMKAKNKTSQAIKELMSLAPVSAHRLTGTKIIDVPVKEIKVGDRLLVKAGERVPVDGMILKGQSTLNESMVTGESLPVGKTVNMSVIGATVNLESPLEIKAVKIGENAFLSQIIKMVKAAQGSRPPIQQLVDRISSVFVPVVLGLATLTFIIWFIFGPEPKFLNALVSLIAVLIIACPCAMGLATPLSIMVAIGRGARLGILIKDARALEIGRKTQTIIFDKTGTLTEGKPVVQHYVLSPELSHLKVKSVSSAIYTLESRSAHPLAKAVVDYLDHQVNLTEPLKIEAYHEFPGQGIKALIADKSLLVGTRDFLTRERITLSPDLISQADSWQAKGQTVIYLAQNSRLVGIISIADTLRPAAAKVIAKLRKLHIESVMLTGDNPQAAAAISDELGINNYTASVLPQAKKAAVDGFRREKSFVGMVGDGINDAPALASADLSIAMGNGTEVAMTSADVTLLRSDLLLLPQVLALSKATINNIRQNLIWAFGYNIILIPVAMGALYPFFGLRLNPVIAGAAMAFSSVSVVLNALRLRTVRLED